MQRSRGFGHGVVVSKMCYVQWLCPRFGLQDIDGALSCVIMWLLQTNEQLSRLSFEPLWFGSGAASLSAAMFAKCEALPKGDYLSLHSLPEAWGPWEPQHPPPALHYGWIISIPSLQQQERDKSHTEKRRVWSRSCGLQELLRDIDRALSCAMWLLQTKLLNSMGWRV